MAHGDRCPSPPRQGGDRRGRPTASAGRAPGAQQGFPFPGAGEGAGRLSPPLHHLHVGVLDPLESHRWDLNSCKPPGGSKPTKAAAAFALSAGTKDLRRLASGWVRALTMSNKNRKTKEKYQNTPPLRWQKDVSWALLQARASPAWRTCAGSRRGSMGLSAAGLWHRLAWGDEHGTEHGRTTAALL